AACEAASPSLSAAAPVRPSPSPPAALSTAADTFAGVRCCVTAAGVVVRDVMWIVHPLVDKTFSATHPQLEAPRWLKFSDRSGSVQIAAPDIHDRSIRDDVEQAASGGTVGESGAESGDQAPEVNAGWRRLSRTRRPGPKRAAGPRRSGRRTRTRRRREP